MMLYAGKPPDNIREGDVYFYIENRCLIKHTKEGVSDNKYRSFYDWREFCYMLTGKYVNLSTKESRKEITTMLGCTPTILWGKFKAIVGQLLIDDLQPYAGKLCLKKEYIINRNGVSRMVWRWNFTKLFMLRDCIDKIRQLDDDGLMHLAPLVFTYNMCPKELKEHTGSEWKHICKNSFSRNLLLATTCYSLESLITRNSIPTTVLKQCIWYEGDREMFKLYKASKLFYKDFKPRHNQIYKDTMSMAKKLGRKPKPKNWHDVEKLHDRYTKEMLEKEAANVSKDIITYNIKPFEIHYLKASDVYLTDNIVDDLDPLHLVPKPIKYKCTPLTSAYDLYVEGKTMHHYCKLGNTSFYTNQYTKEYIPEYNIHQHYGPFNKSTDNTRIEERVRDYIKRKIGEIENINNNSLCLSDNRANRSSNVSSTEMLTREGN